MLLLILLLLSISSDTALALLPAFDDVLPSIECFRPGIVYHPRLPPSPMPFHDTALPSDNYDKTFAPIAKMTIVWTVLAIAGSQGWPLQQMDVNNAFLHGKQEEIYMTLPSDMFATLSS